VDTWGTIPFSDTQKLAGNVKPKYDLDENNLYWINYFVRSRYCGGKCCIYDIARNKQYNISGAFSTSKNKLVKFANTLKLRNYFALQ
jgi:hypothetical protein